MEKPRDKGYLKDIFALNDFTSFNLLQRLHGLDNHSRNFTLKEVFKAELIRMTLAVPWHRQWLEMLESRDLRCEIGVEDKYVPYAVKKYLRKGKYRLP